MSELVIEVDCPEDIAREIQRRADQFPEAAAQALWEESAITMNMSLRECPVDTGRMRATGAGGSWAGGSERSADELVLMQEGPDEISAEIGYYTKYAWFVHEILTNYHPVGKAKFLEDPVNMRAEAFPTGLLARINATLDGGA